MKNNQTVENEHELKVSTQPAVKQIIDQIFINGKLERFESKQVPVNYHSPLGMMPLAAKIKLMEETNPLYRASLILGIQTFQSCGPVETNQCLVTEPDGSVALNNQG